MTIKGVTKEEYLSKVRKDENPILKRRERARMYRQARKQRRLEYQKEKEQQRLTFLAQLKESCPFCGEKEDLLLVLNGNSCDCISCSNCGATGGVGNGKVEVIKKWNERKFLR